MIGVSVLGSTGSIGTSTLRVLERQAHRFAPVALTAHANADLLQDNSFHYQASPSLLANSQ